jgi:hypothetical protein
VFGIVRRATTSSARSTCATSGAAFGAGRIPGEERHDGVEHRHVVGREHVVRERQERPEDDVAVRVVGADAAIAIEEREPLRPVAVRVLLPEDAQQQITDRRPAADREQQLDRALAHVARPPAPAGELLEAARREVVHHRVAREPRQDLLQCRQAGRERARVRWMDRHVDRRAPPSVSLRSPPGARPAPSLAATARGRP